MSGIVRIKDVFSNGGVNCLVEFNDATWYMTVMPSVEAAQRFCEMHGMTLQITVPAQEVLRALSPPPEE